MPCTSQSPAPRGLDATWLSDARDRAARGASPSLQTGDNAARYRPARRVVNRLTRQRRSHQPPSSSGPVGRFRIRGRPGCFDRRSEQSDPRAVRRGCVPWCEYTRRHSAFPRGPARFAAPRRPPAAKCFRGRHSMHCPEIGAADSQIDRSRTPETVW